MSNKRGADMVNELSDGEYDEAKFNEIADRNAKKLEEAQQQQQKVSSSSSQSLSYLQKMMKRNDNSAGERKAVVNSDNKNNNNATQPELSQPRMQMMKEEATDEDEDQSMLRKVPSHAQNKRFEIVEFPDALQLKILAAQHQHTLRTFCTNNRLNFRLRRDKKPAFIEVFSENHIPEVVLDNFRKTVDSIRVKVRNEIEEKKVKCNIDEYAHIRKELDDYLDTLNTCEITLVDPEGNQDDQLDPERTYNPEPLRHYMVNQKFVIKLKRIEKPSLLSFSTIDIFLMNVESDQIYTDNFGYELVSKNKEIKAVIKQNREKIAQNSLITDLKFTYEGKDIGLVLQTSRTEQECIANLKVLLSKIDKQELPHNKGLVNIGISLQQSCGKKYLQELLKILNAIKEDDDSYLAFPSEIHLFVSEEKEGSVSAYFNDVIKSKNVNPDKVKKGGKWSQAIQYYGNQLNGGGMYNMNFRNVNPNSLVAFREDISVTIERAFLRESNKVYLATPPLAPKLGNQPGYYKYGRKINVNGDPDDDDGASEEVFVDFDKMTETFLSSKLERPISQDAQKKHKWSFIDTITMEFVQFEEELGKVFKSCQEAKVKSFTYQRNVIDFSLFSKIMKCDFRQFSMTDLQSGDVYAIKREENSKYNYLVTEADPNSKSEMIVLAEVKKEVKKKRDRAQDRADEKLEIEEGKQLGPHLKVRGLNGSVLIVNNIIDKMRKDKWLNHIITLERRIPKSNLKYIEEIAKQNNIEIDYNDKREELVLKGYAKTINRLRNTFIKGTSIQFDDFNAPEDWEPQDKDVEVFECPLDTEYSKHVIKLVRKTLPNARVAKIERVQNIKLWKNFQFEKKKLEEKGDASMRWLFHGTRATDPSVIYKGSEEGFDFRVCQGGMYGRGTYFHDMASYSYNFAFNKGNGKVQLFCARVLVGKVYATPPNGQITVPPYVPGSKSVRYDSIRSNNAIGQNEYVIFNNSKAYPYYLVTITGGNGGAIAPRLFNGFNNAYNNNNYYSDEEEEEDEDFDEDEFYDDD